MGCAQVDRNVANCFLNWNHAVFSIQLRTAVTTAADRTNFICCDADSSISYGFWLHQNWCIKNRSKHKIVAKSWKHLNDIQYKVFTYNSGKCSEMFSFRTYSRYFSLQFLACPNKMPGTTNRCNLLNNSCNTLKFLPFIFLSHCRWVCIFMFSDHFQTFRLLGYQQPWHSTVN